jgi:hypothetical protein
MPARPRSTRKRKNRPRSSLVPTTALGAHVTLTRPEVCTRYTLRRHQLLKLIERGVFPKPERLWDGGQPRWYLATLEEFDAARRAGVA